MKHLCMYIVGEKENEEFAFKLLNKFYFALIYFSNPPNFLILTSQIALISITNNTTITISSLYVIVNSFQYIVILTRSLHEPT